MSVTFPSLGKSKYLRISIPITGDCEASLRLSTLPSDSVFKRPPPPLHILYWMATRARQMFAALLSTAALFDHLSHAHVSPVTKANYRLSDLRGYVDGFWVDGFYRYTYLGARRISILYQRTKYKCFRLWSTRVINRDQKPVASQHSFLR